MRRLGTFDMRNCKRLQVDMSYGRKPTVAWSEIMKSQTKITLFLKAAACVILAVAGWNAGRNFIVPRLASRSVSDRVAEIMQTKPWLSEVAGQAKGRLSILVFKNERRVEVHAEGWKEPRRYAMTGFSGSLGPKLEEGDRQIPEGIYGIEYLNPNSRFHLSLKVSYPNESDKLRAAEDGRVNLGGNIMIHGGSATIGCIPIGDDAIEEIFYLVDAVGIRNVTVIIAPYDMRKGRYKDLEKSQLPWYGALCDSIFRNLRNGTGRIAEDLHQVQ